MGHQNGFQASHLSPVNRGLKEIEINTQTKTGKTPGKQRRQEGELLDLAEDYSARWTIPSLLNKKVREEIEWAQNKAAR